MTFKVGEIIRTVPALARGCWRKERWKSLGAAEAQRRSLLRSGRARNVDRLNAYKCPLCEGYHIGRRKEK